MTLYDVLGIKRNATDKDIKKAYRKKAMQYHPDRNPGDASASAKFREAQVAYECLIDPVSRKRYDETGEIPKTETNQDPLLKEIMNKAASILRTTMLDLFNCGEKPNQMDLQRFLVEKAEKETLRTSIMEGDAQRILRFVKDTLGRVESSDSENPVKAILNDELARSQATAADLEEQVKVMEGVVKIFKEMKYVRDNVPSDAMTVMKLSAKRLNPYERPGLLGGFGFGDTNW